MTITPTWASEFIGKKWGPEVLDLLLERGEVKSVRITSRETGDKTIDPLTLDCRTGRATVYVLAGVVEKLVLSMPIGWRKGT